MFVHDEFILDARNDELGEVTAAIRAAVTDGTNLVLGQRVPPLPIRIGNGAHWAAAKP